MTKRKIVFHNSRNNTYVISDEYIGDKVELEGCDLGTCDKTWAEFVAAMEQVDNLACFLAVVSMINASYHPTINGKPTPEQTVRMAGSRIKIVHTNDELMEQINGIDEVWMVEAGVPGAHII